MSDDEKNTSAAWQDVKPIEARSADGAVYYIYDAYAVDAARAADAQQIATLRAEQAQWQQWQPIQTAPTDGTLVIVRTNAVQDLESFVTVCRYHPDAGWCVDELREVTHWMPLPLTALTAQQDKPDGDV